MRARHEQRRSSDHIPLGRRCRLIVKKKPPTKTANDSWGRVADMTKLVVKDYAWIALSTFVGTAAILSILYWLYWMGW
jgi:hypothetical protein